MRVALRGASSGHTASIRASTETAAPSAASSVPKTARSFGPPIASSSPFRHAVNGPNTV